MSRLHKLTRAVIDPAYWPALARCVVPTVEHDAALQGFQFGTVLDVGANRGQFSTYARRRWPQATIHAFEPLPGARMAFSRVVGSAGVHLHAVALGSRRGVFTMHIANRDDSSSLLPTGTLQTQLFRTHEIRSEPTEVVLLDEMLAPANLQRPVLMKLDVQGYELEVLNGAQRVLEFVDVVFVEASTLELYEGQALADSLVRFISDRQFTFRGCFNQKVKPGFGLVQGDLLFVKSTGSR